MTTETKYDDFSLTYANVEQILGLKRRYIQELVSANKLERRLGLDDKNGKVAYFSKRQVEELADQRGVRHSGAESTKSGHVKPDITSALIALDAFNRKLEQKDAELVKWAQQAGKLEGELGQIKPQLTQALEREKQYKHKIAELEPKLEALTQKLHKEEVIELQTETATANKRYSRTYKQAIVGWAGFIVIFIVFLLAVMTAPAFQPLRQSLNIP
jgi:chromosome segregation ATPase